jgi:uncharacterized repeat protein (TIGR01451 family)
MRRTALIAAGAVAVALTGCMPRQPWTTDLLSVDPSGTTSGNGGTGSELEIGTDFAVSPDGALVAFSSDASNLVAGDDNDEADVFVRDLATGTTTLVSTSVHHPGSADGESRDVEFSPDSTKLLFRSDAWDLDEVTDQNQLWDMFVWDVATGETTLVSVNSAGTASGNFYSFRGSFGGDGTTVVFDSYASDLDPTLTDDNRDYDVYLRDLLAGTTTLVTPDASGAVAGGGFEGRLSPDGSKVLFMSWEDGYGPADPGFDLDLYARDLATGTTSLVTANPDGTDGADLYPVQPRFSPDGRRVLFSTGATNLVPHDTNGSDDVFERDLAAGTTTLVSANADGTASAAGHSSGASYSPDGTKVLFRSIAGDLGPHDPAGNNDAYVRDLATGATTLVSRNADGTGGNGHVWEAVFNADATMVAFVSNARDLVPSGPRTDNVYVADLVSGQISLASPNAEGTSGGNNGSASPRFVTGRAQVVFLSSAFDLDPRDANSGGDLYLATYAAADLATSITASPEPVAPGGTLTYTVTAANTGPDPAPGTELGIALAPGTTLASVTGDTGTCAEDEPGLVRCALGDLGTGAEATVTLTTTVAGGAGPALDAYALVTSGRGDVDHADNFATVRSTVAAAAAG